VVPQFYSGVGQIGGIKPTPVIGAKGGIKHRPNLIYFSVVPVSLVVPDILVEEVSVATGSDKLVYYVLWNLGIAVFSAVIQRQV